MSVSELLKRLTPASLQGVEPLVRNSKATIGTDSTGDPAVFVTVVLDNAVTDEAIIGGKFGPLEDWIHQQIWEGSEYAYWPYVTLRRVAEMTPDSVAV